MKNNDQPGERAELSSFHPSIDDSSSKVEVLHSDGDRYYDPDTAHRAAGDPGYLTRLPKSCLACLARALAEAEAENATQVDEGYENGPR